MARARQSAHAAIGRDTSDDPGLGGWGTDAPRRRAAVTPAPPCHCHQVPSLPPPPADSADLESRQDEAQLVAAYHRLSQKAIQHALKAWGLDDDEAARAPAPAHPEVDRAHATFRNGRSVTQRRVATRPAGGALQMGAAHDDRAALPAGLCGAAN